MELLSELNRLVTLRKSIVTEDVERCNGINPPHIETDFKYTPHENGLPANTAARILANQIVFNYLPDAQFDCATYDAGVRRYFMGWKDGTGSPSLFEAIHNLVVAKTEHLLETAKRDLVEYNDVDVVKCLGYPVEWCIAHATVAAIDNIIITDTAEPTDVVKRLLDSTRSNNVKYLSTELLFKGAFIRELNRTLSYIAIEEFAARSQVPLETITMLVRRWIRCDGDMSPDDIDNITLNHLLG